MFFPDRSKEAFSRLELFALSVRVCLFARPGVDVSMGTGGDGIVGGEGGMEERSFLRCVGCFDLLGVDICLAGGCVAPDFVHLPILSKLNKSGWGSNHFCSYAKMDKNG